MKQDRCKRLNIRGWLLSKFSLFFLCLILLSTNLVTLFLWKGESLFRVINQKIVQNNLDGTYPEINELSDRKKTFVELKSYFQNLANEKGAVYAFEVLKLAPMPPNTDMHLMGHVVGEALYKQKGAEGIKYCTQDFRNACSHTIVVGLLLEHGDTALDAISNICKQAPGGSGAYSMCYHGLGHGVLAYSNYDLPKTVELCKRTGTKENNFREYGECVGGAIMEQISGGDHDKTVWEKQRKVNLRTDDPLYPCNSNIISDPQSRTFCYLYITPHLFNLGGANYGGKPTDSAIKQAFTFCELIPENSLPDITGYAQQDKKTCFGGFGKEFVVLAKDRDIRKIETMTEKELKQVSEWCLLANSALGIESCNEYVVGSLFWGGENEPNAAIRYCSTVSGEYAQKCYSTLFSQVKTFKKESNYLNSFCKNVPKEYYEKCISI